MGMMLRRHKRTPDGTPMVNGKPVKSEPKKRSLTNDNESKANGSAAPRKIII
jgi:hypothetical protein